MSKLVEIIEDKQVIIDKSDLDFIYNQIEEKAYESYIYKKALELACLELGQLNERFLLSELSLELYVEEKIKWLKAQAKEQLKDE